MDWLKDKKNQPIVAAIACTLIVAGLVCAYLFTRGPSADAPAPENLNAQAPAPDPTTQQQPAPQPSPGAPAPAAPAATGTPAAGAAPAGTPAAGGKNVKVASVMPMQTWRDDPFQPIGYKKPQGPKVKVNPPILDFPFERLPGIERAVAGPKGHREKPELPQPQRRMAGILLNDRVYAIIESNGVSDVYQPGDTLKDRLASVEKIEPDRVILKTADDKPRYITVKMAASPHVEAAASGAAPMTPSNPYGPTPGGPPPGIRRGAAPMMP